MSIRSTLKKKLWHRNKSWLNFRIFSTIFFSLTQKFCFSFIDYKNWMDLVSDNLFLAFSRKIWIFSLADRLGGWNQIFSFSCTTKQMSNKKNSLRILLSAMLLISPSNHHLQCQVWRYCSFSSSFSVQDKRHHWIEYGTRNALVVHQHTWLASERESESCKKFMNRLSLWVSYVALFVGKKQLFRLKCTFCWIFGCPSFFTPSFFARFFASVCFSVPFAFFWFSVPPWRAYFFLPVAECLKGVVPFRFSCLLKAALSTTTTTTAATTTYA